MKLQVMNNPAATYLLGGTTIDITPAVGSHLSGFAARTEPASGIDQPLRGVVTVIQDGSTAPLLLVSFEWLGFYERTDCARARILAALTAAFPQQSFDPSRIVLGASHTHYGPCIRADVEKWRHNTLDEAYIERTLMALADASVAAMRRREPCSLRFGVGHYELAASRRRPNGRGGVDWAPATAAPHDHSVPVLVAENAAGQLRHLLFGYTSHPTAGGAGGRQIGGDYPGFAISALAARCPGATVGFFQGCAGDQKPGVATADGNGFQPLDKTAVCRLGEELADAVMQVVAAGEMSTVAGPLHCAREFLQLCTAVPDQAEIKAAQASPHVYEREWAKHLLDLLAAGLPLPREHSFEIQAIRFGSDLAILTFAAEMTVEHQLRIKHELASAFRQVWVIAYANAIIGYVPVKRQISEGGYEVVGSNRHMRYSGPFVPETEERIHNAVRRLLAV